jgi:RNA recognition motif-containing protein
LFKPFGPVARVDVPTDYQGRPKGFATVLMESIEVAEKATGKIIFFTKLKIFCKT